MKAIPLFIGYETGILQRSLNDQTKPRVSAILGTTLTLQITFYNEAGEAVELDEGSTGRLVCRAPDALDGATVLLDSSWDHTADTTLYTLKTLADSEQLRGLIKSTPCYTLSAQIEFTIPGEDDPRKSLAFDLEINNGPARGDEGAPDIAGLASWLWLKEKLEAGNNITLTKNDTTRVITITATGSAGGGADWGDIGGTLSNQTDLQTALNAKLSTATAASTYQPIITDGSLTIAKTSGLQTALDGKLSSSTAASTYLTITDAEADYQPLSAILTELSGMTDSAGVLYNNGSGSLFYLGTSSGGNGADDQGKIVRFDGGAGGTLSISDNLFVKSSTDASKQVTLRPSGLYFLRGAGDYTVIGLAAIPGAYTNYLPSASGTLALTDGNITGTAAGLSSTLAVDKGGTGQTSYTDGQLLIGNSTGNTLAKSTLTAGTGIAITNGGGSITIASTASGGTVTSVAASVPSFLSVSGSPITSSGTLAISLSGTALPVANGGTGLTALGTGITSALATNVGSAGAPVLFNGAGGTPSSIVLTNATGTAAGLSVGNATSATSATYAGGLATTGATVVVSGASAPTTGQVLTATSSTAANWQTPSSGGGKVAQVVYTEDATAKTSTASIPLDDTIPQNTEGTAYTELDTTITPTNASSYLLIEVSVPMYVSASNSPIIALFKDSGADAIAVANLSLNGVGFVAPVTLRIRVPAGSTSAQTFKLRFGRGGGSITVYLNDYSTAYFGGTNKSSMTITEILP